jgi:hypothetical protein
MADETELKENLKRLSALTGEIASLQENLSAQQAQLARLQSEQKGVQQQQQQLNQQLSVISRSVADAIEQQRIEQEKLRLIAEQQLATQREIAIQAQQATADGHIRTLILQADERRRERQRLLKNAFFSLRRTLDGYASTPELLTRLLLVDSLKEGVLKGGLNPEELEEISDKEYAVDVLRHLEAAQAEVSQSLSDADRNDLTGWKTLPAAIASGSESIRAREDELKALPGLMSKATKDLELLERQHAFNAPSREQYRVGARNGLVAGAIMATLIAAFWLLQGGQGPAAVWWLLAIPALYSIIMWVRESALDYTNQIDALQQELSALKTKSLGAAEGAARLEADKNALREQEQQLNSIYIRHPELRGFRLPSFSDA